MTLLGKDLSDKVSLGIELEIDNLNGSYLFDILVVFKNQSYFIEKNVETFGERLIMSGLFDSDEVLKELEAGKG